MNYDNDGRLPLLLSGVFVVRKIWGRPSFAQEAQHVGEADQERQAGGRQRSEKAIQCDHVRSTILILIVSLPVARALDRLQACWL